ncbi:MAG TPA: hypothetical protein VNM48_18730, partial [Chloroflexota bacterium]|nr:hypothetical protein [Chloroflexota bacterium]
VRTGDVGWYYMTPNAATTTAVLGAEPALVPQQAAGRGWIIHETAGKTLAAGEWAITLTTSTTQTGVARVQCRAWIVTVTSPSITANTSAQSAFTDSTDVLALGNTTSTCILPGLATQTTLGANQYLYVEVMLNVTTNTGSNPSKNFSLAAEGTGSAISIPPPGTAPNMPTITTPISGALSDPTIDIQATYTHLTPVQGALEYELASDAAFTSLVQVGTSALLSSGAVSTFTTEALPAGLYYLRLRARDTSDLISNWTLTRTVTVSTPPGTPTNVAPTNASSTSDTTPTLQSSAFSDPDSALGDSHTASQWQIALAGYDWSTGQDSAVTTADLTSWTPPTALATGTTWQWRVRHRDAYTQWSSWSTPTTFTVAVSSVTLTIDQPTLNLGLQAIGADDFGTFTATVTTTNATGYQLTALGTATGATGSQCGGCAAPFADWIGTGAVPTIWTAGATGTNGYTGITIRNATGGRLSKWGTGTATAETDTVTNAFAALDTTTPTVLHNRTTATASDPIIATWRTNPSATTSSATHTETLTITATANP